jgi:transposase
MLNFTGSLRVFLGIEPVDLRKRFSGLLALVMNRLREDRLQGALFVFSNCSRSRLKVLSWEGTDVWVLVKCGAGAADCRGGVNDERKSAAVKGGFAYRLRSRQPVHKRSLGGDVRVGRAAGKHR